MKTVISIFAIILCVVVLFFGQLHWNEKTDVSDSPSQARKDVNQGSSSKSNTELDSLLTYTKNWPTESVDTLKANVEAGQPFKIAILGSSALGEGKDSWPEIVKASLNDAFAQNVTVSTFTYDLTSLEFVNKDKVTEVIEEQPDLVLFEPFTLKDNGLVTIDDSLENATSTITEIKESLPDTVVLIQPPHPLYQATYYPVQVEALAQYAEDNGIPYLNHWEAWPDQDSKELKEYLTKDSSQPSVKGHGVWAEYLIDYFIAK